MAHAYVIAQCDEVAELLGVVLRRRGMTMDFFRESEAALGALRSDARHPDAIVVGCVPPIMTGQHDLLEQLSKIAWDPAARTIVLTDSPNQSEVVAHAHMLGIPVVLSMPFDLDELGRALDQFGARRGAA